MAKEPFNARATIAIYRCCRLAQPKCMVAGRRCIVRYHVISSFSKQSDGPLLDSVTLTQHC